MKDLSRHPCFDASVSHSAARVHLPVAPKCNIQCAYCNRKFDCCNESRPGVCSAVLQPAQALNYLQTLTARLPNITVVGIAGPGDPFANVAETLETLRLVNEAYPDMLLCLSTNGLALLPYVDDIARHGVSHVTITINSLRTATLGKIYSRVNFNRRTYQGEEAGRVLLEQQKQAVTELKKRNIIVKINTIICPGINDAEVVEMAQTFAAMGADTMNCIPLYPVAGTAFAHLTEPPKAQMCRLKAAIAPHIKPMAHCARCRADAVGLLGHDNADAMHLLHHFTTTTPTEMFTPPSAAGAD